MKKRIYCVFLWMFAFTFLLPFFLVPVYAAQTSVAEMHGEDYTTGELAQRLEDIFYSGISDCVTPDLPPVGSSMNNSQMYTTTFANQNGSKMAWQCLAYAQAAYSALFGYNLSDPAYQEVFSDAVSRSAVSYDLFSGYGIRCGAYLRTTPHANGDYSSNYGHSIIILSYDQGGITTLEGNEDGNGSIRVVHYSWDDFNQKELVGKGRYISSLVQPTRAIFSALTLEEPVPSTLSVSGVQAPEGTLALGNVYALRGVISSNYTITRVWAQVVKKNGIVALSMDQEWNSAVYDIRYDGINSSFTFGKLTAGEYTYQVSAEDASGNSQVLITTTFEVKAPVPCTDHSKTALWGIDPNHPHYSLYECGSCGVLWADSNSSNYVTDCTECAAPVPGKPALKNMKEFYPSRKEIFVEWDPAINATHYTIFLDKKSGDGGYERVNTYPYACSGTGIALDAGEYRVLLQATCAQYWEGQNNSWNYTNGDWVYFSVIDRAAITENPVDVAVEANQGAVFAVTATGTDLKYQWQYKTPNGVWKNNTCEIAVFEVNPVGTWRNGYQYRCAVTDWFGTTYSESASLEVLPVPIITAQPEDVAAKIGSTVAFSVAADGSGVNYQWQYKTPTGGWTNSPASGNKSDTLIVPATKSRNGYEYRCKVSNGSGTVYSDPASLGIIPAPVITVQPISRSVGAAEMVSFSVFAEHAESYQWQYRAKSTDAWKSAGGIGNKTATMTFNPATAGRNGYQYRCLVTGAGGTVYSDVVTLTVATKPVIIAQPQSVAARVGETAIFSVTAADAASYQWQYKTPTGVWTNSPADGNKTATLTVPITQYRNGNLYRCIVTGAGGSVTCDFAALTVLVEPVIMSQPEDVTAGVGGTVSFCVSATGATTYQWQYKTLTGSWTNSPAEGNKTATLVVPVTAFRNGYQYRCIVTGAGGSVVSNAAVLTVT